MTAIGSDELSAMVDELLGSFDDARTRAAVTHWKRPLIRIQPCGEAWLVFDAGNGRGIAYSLEDVWADTPWGIVNNTHDDVQSESWGKTLEEACQLLVHGAVVDDKLAAKLRKNIEKQRRKKQSKS